MLKYNSGKGSEKMLRRFISYYRPHVKIFTLDMLASLGMSVIGIFYPIVLRRMLNDFIPNKQLGLIVTFALILCGLYIVRMGLNYFIQYQGHVMGSECRLRCAVTCSKISRDSPTAITTTTKREKSCQE